MPGNGLGRISKTRQDPLVRKLDSFPLQAKVLHVHQRFVEAKTNLRNIVATIVVFYVFYVFYRIGKWVFHTPRP